MSEFKGTKGKWETRKAFENPFLVRDEENNREWFSNKISVYDPCDNGRVICNVQFMTDVKNMGWGHNETTEKWQANAQLISKAPEMLEMLQGISELNEGPSDFLESVRKLIKEATTI